MASRSSSTHGTPRGDPPSGNPIANAMSETGPTNVLHANPATGYEPNIIPIGSSPIGSSEDQAEQTYGWSLQAPNYGSTSSSSLRPAPSLQLPLHRLNTNVMNPNVLSPNGIPTQFAMTPTGTPRDFSIIPTGGPGGIILEDDLDDTMGVHRLIDSTRTVRMIEQHLEFCSRQIAEVREITQTAGVRVDSIREQPVTTTVTIVEAVRRVAATTPYGT